MGSGQAIQGRESWLVRAGEHDHGAGGKVWDFDYNALGQRTAYAYPNGMSTSYGYDGANRLTSIEHKDGATVKAGWSYGLDDNGNILRMALAAASSGQAWDYGYDGRGRLVDAIRRNAVADPRYGVRGRGNLCAFAPWR